MIKSAALQIGGVEVSDGLVLWEDRNLLWLAKDLAVLLVRSYELTPCSFTKFVMSFHRYRRYLFIRYLTGTYMYPKSFPEPGE